MRHVIIGAGPAGVEAALTIREQDSTASITVVSDEPTPPYSRVLLTYVLAGIPDRRLFIWGKDVFARTQVEFINGVKAVTVRDCENKVVLSDGRAVSFDRLLLASGASPSTLSLPGIHLKGVTPLRQYAHIEAMRRLLPGTTEVLVVGAGLVGLKTAEALWLAGKKVTVVASSNQVLSQTLSPKAAALVRNHMEHKGITVLLERDVVEFRGKDRLQEALLSDGTTIKCEIAVVAKGVHPNVDFLSGSGVSFGRGVVVNERLETTRPGIYAAGDAVETYDSVRREQRVNPLWPNAVEQGRLAGLNMTGCDLRYRGTTSMNVTKLLGLPIMSCGETRLRGNEGVSIGMSFGLGTYRELIFKGDILVGAVQVGEVINSGALYWLVRNGTGRIQQAGELISYPGSYVEFAQDQNPIGTEVTVA